MSRFRLVLTLTLSGLLVQQCAAAAPDVAGRQGLRVLPERVSLHGEGATQRLLLERVDSGEYTGPETSPITWTSSDDQVVLVGEDGTLTAVTNGNATITARVGNHSTQCTVRVDGADRDSVREFSRHVLPVLSKAGCNSGACHGALAGKGGFKLSLRGYNPVADHFAITRQARGRRIELADPGRSLLLAKPSAALPHKGGLRLSPGSADYSLLAEWITSGAPSPSSEDAQLVRLEVFPQNAALEVGDNQPLLVRAIYSDGREEDVTRWAQFSSTREAVARVDDAGNVAIVGNGQGAVVAWFSSQIVMFRTLVPFENTLEEDTFERAPRRNFIDDLVLAQLERLNLAPSPRADDAQFLRRAFLDAIGTLPSPEETQRFLTDARPDKRDRAIEELLARSEFVDYWSHKWSDVLLVNGRRLRPRAVKAYYGFIRQHVADNTSWDHVVREIVTATGETEANGATNFYSLHQSPEEMTENVCQAFMSLSIGCAKCHNHPLEKWTNDQYYAMASHFSRVRAKGWGGDSRSGDGIRTLFLAESGELVQPTRGVPQPPTPLDGDPLDFAAEGDRRAHLADWLTSPENPYFSRALANRVWANFFGLGLVNPIDDLRASNPATNEPLLDALAGYLAQRGFDLKVLMRLILQSETYQRSSLPLPENKDDQFFFSRYFPRRLSAEVLLDAIAQVTEVPTEFSQIGYDGADFQATEEYPLGTRAIQLADSAVVSNFLKTFGRNDRDITCECERSNTPSIVQVLHINNGVTINDRLSSERSCIAKAIDADTPAIDLVQDAFMRSLSRKPTAQEETQLVRLLAEATDSDRRQLVEDLYWSILSSREFLFNH